MRRFGWISLTITLLFSGLFAAAAPKSPDAEKRILLLYSFSINFAPDFQLSAVFNRTISESNHKLRVKHLELNAFANEDASGAALDARLAPLLPEIRNGEFDVIIPFGQIAINLLIRHKDDIPANTAVVFCGLDIATRELVQAHPNTTGALGRVSVADNIELGLHFFPETKRIILLTNWSIQGKRILNEGQRYEESYPGIEYIYPDNATTGLNELLTLIQEQDENTLVFFYSWYNRDTTNLNSLHYMMSHLERGKAPIFALQEPMLWNGAIGGIFTELEPIGIALSRQVEQILGGSKASELTIAALPLKTVINWSAVKSGRISKTRIPVAAEVVGGNIIFKEENYPILIVGGTSLLVFAALLTWITLLFFRLRRMTRRREAVLRHIPGRLIVSDPDGRPLFLHTGDMNCGSADPRLGALPCDCGAEIREMVRQVLATGEPRRFEHEFDGRQYSVEIVKLSADIFGVDAVLWVLTDIDELSRTRRQLDESLHQSRLTLDSVADAVIVTDAKARITYLNPAACAMLGSGLRSVTGHPVEKYFELRPEDGTPAGDNFSLTDAILQEVAVTRMYNHTLHVTGRKPRNVIFNLTPIAAKDLPPIGSVLTIRDITPLKEYQNKLVAAMHEAQNASRVKSSFLATMSHELRTPLNAVIGFSEVLQQKNLTSEEQLEYLKSIRFAGATLLDLINNILDLSKIEAEQMILTPRPTDAVKLCRELGNLFKPAADKKGIEIRVEVPKTAPVLLLDEMRLRQILLNLVGNAVKFTEVGSVTLKVEFASAVPDAADLTVHVIDTGVGIRPEAQGRIFEPFVQQDAERDTQVFKGTGLGLTISSRLAQHMGGSIQLTSHLGKGSDFTLQLKQVPVAALDSLPAALPHHPPLSHLAKPEYRILLVDDVPMNLKVLQALLKKFGIAAITAHSAEEALLLMHRECPDVVLTDLWMPGINGRDLAREIRATAAFSHVKVYAVTADTETNDAEPLTEFDGVIYKPLSMEKLREFLNTLT